MKGGVRLFSKIWEGQVPIDRIPSRYELTVSTCVCSYGDGTSFSLLVREKKATGQDQIKIGSANKKTVIGSNKKACG